MQPGLGDLGLNPRQLDYLVAQRLRVIAVQGPATAPARRRLARDRVIGREEGPALQRVARLPAPGPARARPWRAPPGAWGVGRGRARGVGGVLPEPLPEVFDLATEVRQLPLVPLGESQDRRLGSGREPVPNLGRQWRDRLQEGGSQRVPEPGKFGP